MPGGGQGQNADLGFFRGHFLGGRGRSHVVQPEPGDEGVDLQLLQQPHGLGLVALAHFIGTLSRLNGGVGADGAQHMAQLGICLALQEMLPLLGLDDGVVDVGVNIFQRAEFLHQVQGCFFTDAPHAGDVIGGVAHQALHLDELFGLNAVFLVDGVHIHGDGLAPAHGGGGQQYGGALAHQLQAVAVSGGQVAVVLAGVAGSSQGAQNVVGLPALGRHGAVAQVGQKLFQHRHLLGQLFGHPVTGGLVAVIHLVAERGGPQVERHGHLVGVALLEQGEQDIQKAINGVGIAAVLGGQQLDAKKRTVGNAVAVNDQ